MILDIASLQFVAALGSILAGAIHFAPAMAQGERGRWAVWWGWGKILVGLANGAVLCFDGAEIGPLERLSNGVLLIGMALCMYSALLFARYRPRWPVIAAVTAILALTMMMVLIEGSGAGLPFVAMGVVRVLCNSSIAFLLFHMARTEKLHTAGIIGALFAAAVPLFLIRTLLPSVAAAHPAWSTLLLPMAQWSVGVGIVLVTLCHFALLLTHAECVQRSLADQASRDFLTGALNRFGMGRIESTLRGSVTLLLIDIDRFKALNDGQGHAAGDTVLRLLSDLAQAEMGVRGTLVRIGGDEFLCILPDCDEITARVIATRLSDRFDRAVAALVEGPLYPSLSIGMAQGSVDGRLDRLIERADATMYVVKRSRYSERGGMLAAAG